MTEIKIPIKFLDIYLKENLSFDISLKSELCEWFKSHDVDPKFKWYYNHDLTLGAIAATITIPKELAVIYVLAWGVTE